MSIAANEGTQYLTGGPGRAHTLTYDLNVTPTGGVAVVAYDVTSRWEVVTDRILDSAVAAVAADVATLPQIDNMVVGHTYRIYLTVPYAGGVESYYVEIVATR